LIGVSIGKQGHGGIIGVNTIGTDRGCSDRGGKKTAEKDEGKNAKKGKKMPARIK